MSEIKNGFHIVDKPTLASCQKFLDKEHINIDNCIVTTEVVVHKNWEFIVKRLAQKRIDEWKTLLGASKCIILFNTGLNFRDNLHLLNVAYKSNRDPNKKPKKLKEVRELIQSLYYCEYFHDVEADDGIAMYMVKGSKNPGSYIAITPDKDAKQTPGYLFNPMNNEIRECSGFGEIELIVKQSPSGSKTYKIDGKGRSFFYYQMICGDPIDSYSFKKPPVTPYRFYNDFKDIKNDKEAWQYIVNTYYNHFGNITEYIIHNGTIVKGTYLDIIQTYCDVVHMRRWENDRIDVRKTLKKLGVEFNE